MIPQVQVDILKKLASLCSLSPGARFGQLAAHLGVLAEDMFEKSLWDIDDQQLLRVMDRHESELESRQSNVA